jgi:hypothetical protein
MKFFEQNLYFYFWLSLRILVSKIKKIYTNSCSRWINSFVAEIYFAVIALSSAEHTNSKSKTKFKSFAGFET